MKVKFNRDVEIEVWDLQAGEQDLRLFRHGSILNIEKIEEVDKFHSDLILDNGKVLADVPVTAFEVIS